MNEQGAVQAVYDTVENNQSTLLDSLEQNGENRVLECLTDTLTQGPAGYYAIAIHCRRAEEFTDPLPGNVNVASRYRTLYHIEMLVADQVLPDPDDDLFGETAADNFRTFCDRIVQLFRVTQKWFPNDSADPKYCLYQDPVRGRYVEKRNDPPDTDGTSLFLSAAIRFTLAGCNDQA
jgi:hypothetical protein